MFVSYQAASKSAIVEMSVRLNGDPAKVIKGDVDMKEFGSIWFVAPDSGSYTLSVGAKNAFGCERVATALFPVVVK